jgi:hypothetical protein
MYGSVEAAASKKRAPPAAVDGAAARAAPGSRRKKGIRNLVIRSYDAIAASVIYASGLLRPYSSNIAAITTP